MIVKNFKKSFHSYLINFTILFFVLLPSGLFPQNNYEKSLKQGVDALYNFKFEKAEKIFDDLLDQYPENPVPFLYKSVRHLWLYLDSRQEESAKEFLNLSEKAINGILEVLKKDPDNAYYNYLIGTGYSYRALAFARSEEYLNALWATKNFYSYLNKAIELDSTFYDAYLGIGIYNFAVSQTAPAWKWALELTGISGDKKLGFEYLNLTAKKGNWSKVDAQFYLSQLLSEFQLDLNTAEKYLTELNNKYKDNLLFKLTLAEIYIKNTELRKAEKKLKEIIYSPDTLFKQIKFYSNFSLGNVFFYENNFDSAAFYYNEFLISATDNHFKGIAALRAGLCYTFLERPEDAKSFFGITSDGNMDLDEDRYAQAKGRQYLQTPPDSTDLNIIFASNLIRSGKYTGAIDSLTIIIQDSTDEKIKAAAFLHLSDAYYYKSNFKESLNYATAAFKIENTESWIKPFSCYYAARASSKLKSLVDANLFIKFAGNYSDYFYESRLKNLLYSLSYSINE